MCRSRGAVHLSNSSVSLRPVQLNAERMSCSFWVTDCHSLEGSSWGHQPPVSRTATGSSKPTCLLPAALLDTSMIYCLTGTRIPRKPSRGNLQFKTQNHSNSVFVDIGLRSYLEMTCLVAECTTFMLYKHLFQYCKSLGPLPPPKWPSIPFLYLYSK